MQKAIIILIAIIICLAALYQCRPGYVVFMDKVYFNQISEGAGFNRIRIYSADARTFRVHKEWSEYDMDKNKAYFFAKPIFGSDGPTFELLQGNYQKDKNHVYYSNRIIESADVASFKAFPIDSLGHSPVRFSEDKNDFYYCGIPIGVYDRESFRQLYVKDNLWGYDSKYCYYEENKCEISGLKHFKVFESGLYAKDSIHVFYCGKLVEGADAETFQETEIFRGKDKYGSYDMGKSVDSLKTL